MSRQGTHTTDSSKELCISLTHDRMAAKEDRVRLRPLGDPCRLGCMEAGWLLKGEGTQVSCGDTGLQGRQARRKGP